MQANGDAWKGFEVPGIASGTSLTMPMTPVTSVPSVGAGALPVPK